MNIATNLPKNFNESRWMSMAKPTNKLSFQRHNHKRYIARDLMAAL